MFYVEDFTADNGQVYRELTVPSYAILDLSHNSSAWVVPGLKISNYEQPRFSVLRVIEIKKEFSLNN